MFPEYRPRRIRRTESLRAMVRETDIALSHLIYPLFVVPGKAVKQPIGAMPGCYHLSVDKLIEEAKEIRDLGIPGIILFGIPEKKDARGSEAWARNGIVQKAVGP